MKMLIKITLQRAGDDIQLCFSDKEVKTVILNVSSRYFHAQNTCDKFKNNNNNNNALSFKYGSSSRCVYLAEDNQVILGIRPLLSFVLQPGRKKKEESISSVYKFNFMLQ